MWYHSILGGGPGAQNRAKSTANLNVTQASAKVPHISTQRHPYGGKGCQNNIQKLSFGSPAPPFSKKIRDSGLCPEPCYLQCFNYI